MTKQLGRRADALIANAASGAANAGGWFWWLTAVGLCVALLVPLLVVDMPPLLDYPNHLARTFVLASLPGDPVLARFYAPHWSIIPNLALDLAGPPLMHLLPVHVVGRLLIAAAVLLPVLGTIAFNSALGARAGWWSLSVGLVAYNSTLLSGFLNFTISLGLALLLAAGWLRWRVDRPVVAVGLAMAGGVVLFACHLMGLLFFAMLIGSWELRRLIELWDQGVVGAGIRQGAVLLLVFVVPAGLYAVSDLRSLGGDAVFVGFDAKLSQFLVVFAGYNKVLDLAGLLLAAGVPLIALVLGKGTIPAPAAIATIVLIVVYAGSPSAWKGTFSLDIRFAVMLGFVVFAGFEPHGWAGRVRAVVGGVVVVVFLARMGLLTAAWAAHNADIADVRTVLATVQPGQVVYVASASVEEAPGYWADNPGWRRLWDGSRLDEHVGALVLLEHRAYWPFEFDVPSQQPIETREPYRSMAERVGHLANWRETVAADLCGFDHVLLLAADSMPDLPVDRFGLIARSGYAALYAIKQCKPVP